MDKTASPDAQAESISIDSLKTELPRILREAAKPRDVKWGDMKGQIWMADDFCAPLDDMKEYM